uniref:hypothetical protein n=1 Tax=Coccidioides posadasii TaxID=199306 RepID=UPI001D033433|nr:hypothetical protein LI437_mgp36 [Coccidioides posadasii]QVG61956.1 hypothetical protein [Coccidioides posadasii]
MVSHSASGGQLNPLELLCVLVLTLTNSDQRFVKGSVNKQNQQEESRTPKINIIYQESITRLPKGSNSYGNGGLILGHSPRMQAMSKVIQLSRSFMDVAGNGASNEMKLVQVDGKFVNLYQLICSKDLLYQAYKNIRSNSGSMTPGVDNLMMDGINELFFDELVKELKTEKFKFTSVKRVYIPKANGKTRPLGIPTYKDKIVQESIRILLEVIFEGKFAEVSHGFRPKRSCHTALHQISKWNGTTWMIEGDIKGFFDNVNHAVLINILEKTIKDQRFVDLLWKLFRAGYIDGGVKYSTYTGVPQGGVVSPILSNIYLNEFDTFILSLIDQLSSKEKLISKVNSKIVKYSNKLSKLHDEYQANKSLDILKQIRELREERNSIPSRIRTGTRIRYVRYADDWLIGIIGDKALSSQIKDQCKCFLNDVLKIELSDEKTKITNVTKNDVRFLGVDIRRRVSGSAKVVYKAVKGRVIKSRINEARLYFYMPVTHIMSKLQEAGFIKTYTDQSGENKLVPNAITRWIFLDHRSIILRYNAVIRGLINYYSFVDNKYSFHSIINFFIHHSCAKTLARKLNLSNRAQAFARFGRYLSSPEENKLKSISLFTLDNFKKNTKLLTKCTTNPVDPFAVVDWSLRSQINPFEPCWVCGEPKDVEMHHVKHIRKGGRKPTGFLALMSTLNRKQIPVCKPCHLKIHNGQYNDISLKDLHIKKGARD